jgi:hypothetical protein
MEGAVMRPKITYANVMATIAVFIALGGVSYAAMKLPKNSVGAKQLKKNAITTAKVKNEAITGAKVKNGTLTGTQINSSTLGKVPSATHADSAGNAQIASEAGKANYADHSGDSALLGGRTPNLFGSPLMSHTELPATSEPAIWWAAVSGIAPPEKEGEEVVMVAPSVTPLYASGLIVFWRGGPKENAAAQVRFAVCSEGEPLWDEEVLLEGSHFVFFVPDLQDKVQAGARLNIRVTEQPNGEEIPAIRLMTSFWLSSAPRE